MPKDQQKRKGTDATTGAEQGIGSGVGTGIGGGTTAGSTQGSGYGVTSGANPTGADNTSVGMPETLGQPVGAPKLADDSAGPATSIDPEAGTGVPPRQASDDIFRDSSERTYDAEAIRNSDDGMGPDIQTGAKTRGKSIREAEHIVDGRLTDEDDKEEHA